MLLTYFLDSIKIDGLEIRVSTFNVNDPDIHYIGEKFSVVVSGLNFMDDITRQMGCFATFKDEALKHMKDNISGRYFAIFKSEDGKVVCTFVQSKGWIGGAP